MKPKILIFIDWYLPGYNAGGPVRSMANMVDHLQGHYNFNIVTRDTDYNNTNPYKDIQPNEWIKINEAVSCYYISNNKLSVKSLKAIIKDTSSDIIYINGIYSWYFSILPLYLAKKHIKSKRIIVAPRGMLAESAIGIKSVKKNVFIALAKIFRLYRKALFHATNEIEAAQIKKFISQKAQTTIAPNLPKKITSQNIPPDSKGLTQHPKTGQPKYSSTETQKHRNTVKLINIARIAPEKNLLFALEALNHDYSGNIQFDIYGSVYNEKYWDGCKALISRLPKNIAVNYHGSIEPQLTEQKLTESHFMFMPTRGENFGHIILESLSCGIPVIISDNTPWKGLHQKGIGWDFPLSDINVFREVIQQCIDMEEPEYYKISKAAFSFASEYCNNPELLNSYDQLFMVP